MTFTSRQVHFWSLDDLHSLRSKFSELTHGDRMFAIYKNRLFESVLTLWPSNDAKMELSVSFR